MSAAALAPSAELTQKAKILAFATMCVGMFIALIDIQIVSASLADIGGGLSAGADETAWVQTSYLIAEIIVIPLSGWLARVMSTRWLFSASAVGFTIASMLCGLAWDINSMIFFRALQGFLGGSMIPMVFTSAFFYFSGHQRVIAAATVGALSSLAPTLGPTVGGWITSNYSWHWLFFINLVPGLACAVIVWLTLDVDRPRPELFARLDLGNVLFLAIFLGCLEFTLDQGPRNDWFDDDTVAWTAVLSCVSGVIFFWRSFHSEHPIIDLRVFRNRNFTITCLVSAALGVSIFTLVYVTPMFLGQVRGFSARQIGEIMMVQGLAMIVVAPFVVRAIQVVGAKPTITVGLLLVAAGSWTNAALTAEWGFHELALSQALRGAGLIFAFVPMTDLALGTLQRHELNNASALYVMTRNLGGAFGLACIATLMNQRSWTHWQAIAESTRLTREPVREALGAMSGLFAGHVGLDARAGPIGLLARQVYEQAQVMTYADVYWLLSISTSLSLLLVPLISRPLRPAQGMGH